MTEVWAEGGLHLTAFVRKKAEASELQQEVIVVKDAGRVREVGGGRGREMERREKGKRCSEMRHTCWIHVKLHDGKCRLQQGICLDC